MAKKKRSAKQRAATRKLVALNKRRASPKRKTRRKASTKRKTRRKSNKAPKRKRPMAKRGLSKITNNPTLKKVLMAAGAVTIATSVAAIVAPSLTPTIQSPIVRAGLGFVAGDFIGAVSNFVLAGGGGLIGRGGNGGAVGGGAGNIGFA